jgi:hypothetical protein
VDPFQAGEVDQDATVDGAVAGHVVAAAADGQWQALRAGVVDRVDDVGGPPGRTKKQI